MQVTEVSSEGLRREFRVVVPAGDIEKRVQARLTELGRQVRLPGFRPGRIPMPILKQRYGRSVMGEILEQTVSATSQQTMTDRGLRPALQPKIEVTKYEDRSDLEYNMAVEVLPEVEAPALGDLELERPVVEVTDEMVDRTLERIASENRSYAAPAEPRPSRTGDQVLIDFEGRLEGDAEPRPEMSGTDQAIVLGSGRFIPGFEEQLVGHSAGDHVTLNLTFPESYGAKDFAGKPATFEVDVKEIRESAETTADDALAGRLGLESLDALRGVVRKQTEEEFRRMSRARVKRQLLDRLADAHRFDVPAGMVDLEFQGIWKQVEDALKRGDQSDPDLNKPEDELKAEYRAIADRRVRLGLLLSEVGRRNNVQVSADELKRAMIVEARRFPGQERQVIEYFQNHPQALDTLRAPLYEDKVVDYILENARVTDRPVSPDELARDPDEADGGETAENAREGETA